jgi:hypothetical protein
MELLLQRKPSADGCTIGQLFVDGVFCVFTLEDVVRDGPKIAHETAIPAGRYRVDVTRSQRFGRMLPILLTVPGFDGIRIHPGNVAADTSGLHPRRPVGRTQERRAVAARDGGVAAEDRRRNRARAGSLDVDRERTEGVTAEGITNHEDPAG